ncbi:MAG: transglutaminase domain-containing protein [Acutalibacteraceae bacterium]|nr:transglutaminase domain-containing protein [Acutalibacteraceae bacterium]
MNSTPKSGLKSAVILPDRNYTVSQSIWDGLISFLFLSGLILSAIKAINIECFLWLVLVLSAVIPVCMLLLSKKPFHGGLFWALPIIGIIICILISPIGTANGFISVCNGIFDSIGAYTGEITTKFVLLKSSSFDNTLFLIVSILSLSLPITLSVKNDSVFLTCVLSVIVLFFCFFVDNLSASGFIFLICAITALVLKKLSGELFTSTKKALLVRIVSLACCVSLTVLIILSGISDKSVDFLNNTRESAEKTIDKIRYGSGYVLPQGDFTSLGNFAPSDNPQLEVVMSNPDSYYLRGFVGEIYTGNGWKQIENDKLYESADLFYWLHQENFYGQTQLGKIAELTNSALEENRIIIKNIGASSKYTYLPYEVISAENRIISPNSIGDSSFVSSDFFGTKSYSFTAVPNQVKCYTSISAQLYEAEKNGDNIYSGYLNNEAHYNEYVYQNYLEVPESAEHIIETLLGTYKTDEVHLDYGTAKQNILAYLSSNITYNEEAEVSNRDFLSCFLQETKSGYSVHFATAATLMFRYYKIPARYVEGYLITPEDVENVSTNSAIIIDETHAHAWTEFYQDGVGWIPFETTTPYFDVMEKADDLTGVQTQNDDNNSDEQGSDLYKDDLSQQGEAEMTQQQMYDILHIVITVVLILLTVTVLVVLFLLLKRIRQKKLLKREFESANVNFAVISMFSYSIKLLCKMKVFSTVNEIYDGQKKLRKLFGEEYEQQFLKAFSVYKEAEFSNHLLTEKDRNCVSDFKMQTEKYFKHRRNLDFPKNKKG